MEKKKGLQVISRDLLTKGIQNGLGEKFQIKVSLSIKDFFPNATVSKNNNNLKENKILKIENSYLPYIMGKTKPQAISLTPFMPRSGGYPVWEKWSSEKECII